MVAQLTSWLARQDWQCLPPSPPRQLSGPTFPRSRTSSPDIQKHAKLLKLSEWNSESRVFVKHLWALRNKIARIANEKQGHLFFIFLHLYYQSQGSDRRDKMFHSPGRHNIG